MMTKKTLSLDIFILHILVTVSLRAHAGKYFLIKYLFVKTVCVLYLTLTVSAKTNKMKMDYCDVLLTTAQDLEI